MEGMMKKGTAADLSTRMAEAHVIELGDEIGDELYKGVDEAIFSFLHLLPDQATTAIIRQGGIATLAGLHDAQLYLVTAEGAPGSRDVLVNCKTHLIRPGHDKVTMAVRFLGVAGPNAIRKTKWQFTMGETCLEIHTHVHPDQGELSDAEVLAQALAEKMGCPLAMSPVEPLVAVI
jgi:hypothetical protein